MRKQKDPQVPCPNCYQMNHYNATRCAHCLGDTWRTPRETSGEEMSNGAMIFWMIVIAIALGYMFGAGAAMAWLGFWIGMAIIFAVGVGRIILFGTIGLAIWIWLF